MLNRQILVRSGILVIIVGLLVVGIVGLARQNNDPQTIASQVVDLIAKNPQIKIDRNPNQLVGVVEIDLSGVDSDALASFANYTPDPSMQQVIDHLDLTDRGRQLILEHHPEFITKADMVGFCGPRAQGCWIRYVKGGDSELSILVVNSLNHQQQTETLAHELLHGVYNNLANKATINSLIDETYLANQSFLDNRLEPYGNQTPEERYHELHSFIGSSVVNLSVELETHYGQYFNDRSGVVSHSANGRHDQSSPSPAPKPQPQPTPAQDCRNAGGDWTGQTCDYRRRDCERSGGTWFGDSCGRPTPDPTLVPSPTPTTAPVTPPPTFETTRHWHCERVINDGSRCDRRYKPGQCWHSHPTTENHQWYSDTLSC